MDRSSSRHHRPEISSQTLESMVLPTNTNPHNQETKKLSNRPQEQEPQKCPRCDSTNTKFCYYNNYSLSQPRYFCKSCRRYWTRGGTLRNVPVGGGCRKNPKKSSPSATKRVPMDQENGPVFPNPIHSFPEPFLGYFDEYDQGVFKADSRVTHLGDLGMGNISGFFEAPNSEFFQSLCYGNIGNMVGMVENGGQERGLAFGYMSGGGGGATTAAAAAAAVKQEVWGGGYPWEGMIGGDGNGLVGGGGSSWQRGLLNSPLM